MGPLGELGALFNPGMRHEEEEKRAKHMLREEEGTGRKGRLGIDLESGVVVIGSGRAGGDAPQTDADDGDADLPDEDNHTGNAGEDRSAAPNSGTAGPGDGAGRNGSASRVERSTARGAKPGEPQVAQRSPRAAPEGKARRRAGDGSATGTAISPVGKARRTQR